MLTQAECIDTYSRDKVRLNEFKVLGRTYIDTNTFEPRSWYSLYNKVTNGKTEVAVAKMSVKK